MPDLPVSVLIATRNEGLRIKRCLKALSKFSDIIVVDSQSTDNTCAIAKECGASVIPFVWNGQYPKKRQWCLDHVDLKHDWVFFVDADEVVTEALVSEITQLFQNEPKEAGFFMRGQYVRGDRLLKYGLKNNKLALMNKHKMEFPVVDDLDIDGMGEIEGHYQPVLKAGHKNASIGQLKNNLLHFAYDNEAGWFERHERYARWEVEMDRRNAWPHDPLKKRGALKTIFKTMPGRSVAAFLHSYIFKRGFLDGAQGYKFARDRYRYYRMIAKL